MAGEEGRMVFGRPTWVIIAGGDERPETTDAGLLVMAAADDVSYGPRAM